MNLTQQSDRSFDNNVRIDKIYYSENVASILSSAILTSLHQKLTFLKKRQKLLLNIRQHEVILV